MHGRKAPSLPAQTVAAGNVSVEQGIAGAELFPCGVDCAGKPRRPSCLKASERQQQQRRIEILRSVGTDVRSQPRVEPFLANFGSELVPRPLPTHHSLTAHFLAMPYTGGAIKCDPGPHFRVHVLARSFTNLPDAGIRPVPVASDDVSVLTENSEAVSTESMACLDEVPDGVDDPAVHIELMLLLGEIANANGAAPPIAGDGAHLTFRCTSCSFKRVEHTDARLAGRGA